MKIMSSLLFALVASVTVRAQPPAQQTLTPIEAAALEAAWASSLRLVSADVPLPRGFNLNDAFNRISLQSSFKKEL